MKPWIEIGRAPAEGGGTLSLHRRDDEFVMRLDGEVLMSSRRHGSEERLAEIGCARLGRRAARVLVGGLGMGFTLRAVLDLLPTAGEVVIAELSPHVVDWNRTALAALARRPLDDPRVWIHVGDVKDVMESVASGVISRFDAILLDVDNSPDALVRTENQALYEAPGLAAAWRALRTDGCLAIWSAAPAPALTRRMRRAGFTVEVHEVRATRGRCGARHAVHAGRRQAPRS